MYDAIIVGARCAGAATALLLARRGCRVLLVDRAHFPSDTLSSHFIQPAGVARLRRWGGIEAAILAAGCPPVRTYRFDVGPFALSGTVRTEDGVSWGYGPRRIVLDRILVEAAVAAGAEFRPEHPVHELLFEDSRVCGIRGPAGVERARIVVGADGKRSTVARAVGAPKYGVRPSRTCNYYSYWSGVRCEGVELHVRPGRTVIAVPTTDDLTLIAVVSPAERFGELRADLAAGFERALHDDAPALAERAAGGQRVDRFYGTADLPAFFRRPFGPGWALVGDAGCHKDPITAQGISDAFRDAELLDDAIGAALAGGSDMAGALAAYHLRRDALALPMYELTDELAMLRPPPPEMQALLEALRGNQPQIDRFLGTIGGSVPILEFYAPENVRRIVESAGGSRLAVG